MPKVRSHYDNLMVAKNASPRVIKAAYKALCQTYHPDKYPGGPGEAERIMKIINAAYQILSDPLKKAEHDAWLAAVEAGRAAVAGLEAGHRFAEEAHGPDADSCHHDRYRTSRVWLFVLCCGAAFLGFFIGSKSLAILNDTLAVSAQSNPAPGAVHNTVLPDAVNDMDWDHYDPAATLALPGISAAKSNGQSKSGAPATGTRASPPSFRSMEGADVRAKRFDPLAAIQADALKLQHWAEQGNALAQYALGMMHFRNGDYSQALFWCRKAAMRDYAAAQNHLGAMYSAGKGVPQDDRQAFYWYRKSAEQGYADAQYHLGMLYANKQGVNRDYNKALYWWRKAARQGHADAAQLLNNRSQNLFSEAGPFASMPSECVIKPVMSDEELENCAK